MNYWRKFVGHFTTVLQHKKEVYKAMKLCGRPVQGLLHDMSKFSPVEFWNSVKYYSGTGSPVNAERRDKGYSDIWLHHKGRNKHHSQYWIDYSFGKIHASEMPFKYLLELICDGIGAGKVYMRNRGQIWANNSPLDYYNETDHKSVYHDRTRRKLEFYYRQIAEYGWEEIAEKIRKNGDYYEQRHK